MHCWVQRPYFLVIISMRCLTDISKHIMIQIKFLIFSLSFVKWCIFWAILHRMLSIIICLVKTWTLLNLDRLNYSPSYSFFMFLTFLKSFHFYLFPVFLFCLLFVPLWSLQYTILYFPGLLSVLWFHFSSTTYNKLYDLDLLSFMVQLFLIISVPYIKGQFSRYAVCNSLLKGSGFNSSICTVSPPHPSLFLCETPIHTIGLSWFLHNI